MSGLEKSRRCPAILIARNRWGQKMYEMINTILAYLISLGIIGAGVGCIVIGMSSMLFIGIGVASIGVGVASLLNELRYKTH